MKKTIHLLSIMVLAVFLLPKLGFSQLLSESFEGTTFPPPNWLIVNNGSGHNWVQNTSSADASVGSKSMKYIFDSNNAADTWAFTKGLSLTNGVSYDITFDYKTKAFPEKLKVTVGNAQTVASQTTTLWDNNGGTSITSTTYSSAAITFTANATGTFYVAFNCYSDADQFFLFVDNIVVSLTPTCPAPSNQGVTSITPNGAQLNWTSGGATNYNIEYGPSGFTQGTGTIATVATDTFKVISGLTAATSYDWYVQDSCSASDVSAWAGPNVFSTNCNVVSTYPWTESFENSFNFSCWSNTGTTIHVWEINNGSSYGPGNVTDGTYAAMFDVFHSPGNSTATMTTPTFDMSSLTNAMLTFDYWMDGTAFTNYWIKVEQSTDGGSTWATIFNQVQDGTISTWQNQSVLLSGVTATTLFRFTGSSNYGAYNIFVDNLKIDEAPQNEIEITEVIGSYGGFNVSSSETVSVIVKNNGSAAQSSIPMKYTLDNGTVVSETMTTTVNAYSSGVYSFTTTYDASTVGQHSIVVYSELTNDSDNSNDTAKIVFLTNENIIVPDTLDFPNTYDTRIDLKPESMANADIIPAANHNQGNGILLEGGPGNGGWNTSNTVTAAFSNTTHVARANTKIDASGSTSLFLDIDFKMFYSYNANYSWFRVIVNGTDYVKSLNGDSVWQPTTSSSDPWQTIALNLNDYAGTIFSLSFETAMKFGTAYQSTTSPSDKIFIDNLIFYQPNTNDIQIVEFLKTYGGMNVSGADTVSVTVRNNGTATQTAIPLKYVLDNGTVVSETLASLAAFSSTTYNFATTFDATAGGSHTLQVYSALSNDEDIANDTLTEVFVTFENMSVPGNYKFPSTHDSHFNFISEVNSAALITADANNDIGNGIKLEGGYSSWGGTPTTVTAAFAKTGHIAKAFSRIDASTSTNLFLEIDFKMFHTFNKNYSWFRIMLNDTIYAKDLNGDSVWQSNLTSSDPWRTITFNLSSYAGSIINVSYEGAMKYNEGYNANYPGDKIYIDNINVYVPASNDISVIEILNQYGGINTSTTETVSVVVKNYGIAAQTNIPIKYTFDNGTVVTENIASLAATATDTLTFTTTFDATPAGSHSLVVYSDLANDQVTANDTITQNFVSYGTIAFPFTEDFESGYTYFNNENTNQVGFNLSTTLSVSGSHSVHNAYQANSEDVISEMGTMNLSNTTHPVLDFWHIAKLESPAYDKGFVEITTDNGATWTALDDSLYLGESVNYSNGYFDETSYSAWGGASNTSPDSTWWKMERFSLEPFKTTTVSFRFRLSADAGTQHDGWRIDDIAVKEEPNPIVDLGNDTSICGGASFTLNSGAGAGYKFVWTRNGVTIPNASTSSINIDSIGTYTVQAIGLSTTVYDTIVIDILPLITFNALSSTCPNSSSFALTGATPSNGTYSGFGVNNGMFDPSIAGIGNHIITYTYTDANGCTNSAQQVQIVNDVPAITTTAANNPAPYNTSTTITATVSNATGGLSYLWTPYSAINGDSTLQTITTTNITSPTTYIVNVYDSITTCSNTDTLDLLYSGGPISINPIAIPTTICNGDTVLLKTQAVGGTGTLNYSWTSNPSGYTSNSENTQATPSVDTWYFITASDGASSTTDSLFITVLPNPVASFVSPTSIICSGDTDTSIINFTGTAPFNYTYNGINVSGISNTADTIYLNPTNTTTYTITSVSDANGCISTGNIDSTIITVNDLPTVAISNDVAICQGDSTLITLNFTGMSPWSFDITDGSTTNTGTSNSALFSAYDDPSSTVTYSLTAVSDGNGCNATGNLGSITITVNPNPVINLGADYNVCINHITTIDAGNGFASYLWSTGATTQSITLDSNNFNVGTNDYSVKVTNNDNCSNSDTITLTVDPCTGILTPVLSGAKISILPNPNKGQFELRISGLENQIYDLGIYNSVGSKVYSESIKSSGLSTQSFKLDFSTYPKGIYYVRLQSKGQISVKKIIIQ